MSCKDDIHLEPQPSSSLTRYCSSCTSACIYRSMLNAFPIYFPTLTTMPMSSQPRLRAPWAAPAIRRTARVEGQVRPSRSAQQVASLAFTHTLVPPDHRRRLPSDPQIAPTHARKNRCRQRKLSHALAKPRPSLFRVSDRLFRVYRARSAHDSVSVVFSGT